jgi:hypothetical protein
MAFLVIQVLHRMGIIARFNDHRPQFERKFGARSIAA